MLTHTHTHTHNVCVPKWHNTERMSSILDVSDGCEPVRTISTTITCHSSLAGTLGTCVTSYYVNNHPTCKPQLPTGLQANFFPAGLTTPKSHNLLPYIYICIAVMGNFTSPTGAQNSYQPYITFTGHWPDWQTSTSFHPCTQWRREL